MLNIRHHNVCRKFMEQRMKRIFRVITTKHKDYEEGYVFNITIDSEGNQQLHQIWQTIDIDGKIIQSVIDIDNFCDTMMSKPTSDVLIQDLPKLLNVYKNVLDPQQVMQYLQEGLDMLEDELMETIDPRALIQATEYATLPKQSIEEIANGKLQDYLRNKS